ncbi:hypothetical protein EAG_07463 [Camponotus floridanus]|uniref:Uncharacterized protein n=1 Tax=Camponotus floridanus TaxID=104421 RepID=E2ACK7_CAMFO|nr:hypothetical protein EAG_07463 [Camponotus floridanus]
MTRAANNLDRIRGSEFYAQAANGDMSETAVQSKRISGPRAGAVTRVETRLPRCVQRRLPCAPVTVKCHPRPSPYRCAADHRVSRRPYKLSVGLSVTNRTGTPAPIPKSCSDRCPSSGCFLGIGTPRCKKSLSMMDLSAVKPDIDLKSESGSTVSRLDEAADKSRDILANGGSGRSWTDATPSSESEQGEVAGSAEDPTTRAANIVCHMLVVNAWRRRRVEIAQLEQQVEHLHLQIEFLRRLLLAENDRVGRLNGELHRDKSQLEEMTRERDAVKLEKDKLEVELKRVEEISLERSVTVGNLKNELLTAQDQLKALDTQMAKDREKLLKLREDKRILLDKVSASEALATDRRIRAEKAESTVEELQLRLAAQVAHAESTQEQLERISKTELRELRERLVRQSQEGGWSSRMLQIAGSIMRASIMRTFAFLSSAALPLPP